IGESDLIGGFGAVVEAGQNVLGVDHGGDGIQLGARLDVVVGEEGLRDGGWIGEAGGFDQDGVELVLALHQTRKNADQIAAHGAADAAVVHLEDFFVGVDDEIVVDADLAELVDDDGVFLAVLLAQYPIQKRGLAGAQIAGQYGYGYL